MQARANASFLGLVPSAVEIPHHLLNRRAAYVGNYAQVCPSHTRVGGAVDCRLRVGENFGQFRVEWNRGSHALVLQKRCKEPGRVARIVVLQYFVYQ